MIVLTLMKSTDIVPTYRYPMRDVRVWVWGGSEGYNSRETRVTLGAPENMEAPNECKMDWSVDIPVALPGSRGFFHYLATDGSGYFPSSFPE